MKAGFTGTRKGMTEKQKQSLTALLTALPISVLHHGMADGADTEVDKIAHWSDCQTAGHPAIGHKSKSKPDFVFPAKEPLDRDTDIAKAGSLLMATPCGFREVRRSGTWATIRQARKARIPVVIIWPDGTLKGEDNNSW